MQPLWLCILKGRPFEEAFKNAQYCKLKQNASATNVNLPFYGAELFEKIQIWPGKQIEIVKVKNKFLYSDLN